MTELVQWSVFQSHAKMTNEIQICFSKWWENEKRNSNPFFKVMRKRKTKNEIHIRFSKWCENEKRKLKLISVFQSDAKTKNEIRSSKPFFKVRRKRKTKSKIQICFSMPCENEKWIWHLNSFLPRHRRTVGTKVHALSSIRKNPAESDSFAACRLFLPQVLEILSNSPVYSKFTMFTTICY